MVHSIIIQEFALKISVSKPAMETKHQLSFTFIEANQCEYCEEQTPLNPRKTDNDMHDDPKKNNRSGNR